MYNLNVSISGPPMLGLDNGGGGASGSSAMNGIGLCSTTPRTPEILNSLIAMTSPLEYSFPGQHNHPHVSITINLVDNLRFGSPIISGQTHFYRFEPLTSATCQS